MVVLFCEKMLCMDLFGASDSMSDAADNPFTRKRYDDSRGTDSIKKISMAMDGYEGDMTTRNEKAEKMKKEMSRTFYDN